jgi:hypothetical protein
LQNRKSTLPFKVPSSGTIAVIGASANSTRLLGGGHYARNLPIVDGFETGGFPSIPVAIRSLLGASGSTASVTWLPGIKCTPRTDSVCVDPVADAELLAEAVAAGATRQTLIDIWILSSAHIT